ncbi:glycosyltransferase family 4 protein [Flavitalea sp. BT771]|uniref:glycosyltransferase family 4 protein n=1 Tax=Flavitalea sp. BT771 TaxID=3063329 RepID=UPI0026E14A08|nr:glycosyltransferase family 4 protein [Flavitalea sp. BT771]MDO6429408.1 glycosyltransferase family 4 protein [Flavitalea sp. BT771]MDV6218464.1 glycosyltransferase family 4 protein [Flavitalea sp. BT771]
MQKRILFWSASYAPVLGGVQTIVSQLATGLQKRGYIVQVLTDRTPTTLPHFEIIENVPVLRYRFFHPVRSIGSLREALLACYSIILFPVRFFQLWHFIRGFRPDVINVHFPGQQIWYIGLLQKWLIKNKWVISLHGHDILRFFKTGENNGDVLRKGNLPLPERIKLNVLSRRLRHAYAVTACSGYLLNMAGKIPGQKEFNGQVVYNGIDFLRFSGSKSRLIKSGYIIALGRLVHAKGFDMLVQAFARLPETIQQQYLLVIAGTGPEKSTLERLAIETGIRSRLRLYGRASQLEVTSLLQHAALAVIPSRQEPFGIALLEAMAAGCKVIATNVGGMPEIAGHGNVLLCEPTTTALSAAMQNLLSDQMPILNPGNGTMNDIFTEETMLKKYEDIFLR